MAFHVRTDSFCPLLCKSVLFHKGWVQVRHMEMVIVRHFMHAFDSLETRKDFLQWLMRVNISNTIVRNVQADVLINFLFSARLYSG